MIHLQHLMMKASQGLTSHNLWFVARHAATSVRCQSVASCDRIPVKITCRLVLLHLRRKHMFRVQDWKLPQWLSPVNTKPKSPLLPGNITWSWIQIIKVSVTSSVLHSNSNQEIQSRWQSVVFAADLKALWGYCCGFSGADFTLSAPHHKQHRWESSTLFRIFLCVAWTDANTDANRSVTVRSRMVTGTHYHCTFTLSVQQHEGNHEMRPPLIHPFSSIYPYQGHRGQKPNSAIMGREAEYISDKSPSQDQLIEADNHSNSHYSSSKWP